MVRCRRVGCPRDGKRRDTYLFPRVRASRRTIGADLSNDTTQKQIRVTRRLDLPCESIGFARPPCRLDLMFLKGIGKWTLLVHGASERMFEVDRWLRCYGPTDVVVGSGCTPTVLRAEFAEAVGGWADILQTVKVRFLQIAPTGLASLFYEDDDIGIPLLRHVMRRGSIEVHDRPSFGGRDASRLTLSQYEVLSLAVGLGYYDAAPRADQREIAVQLGISAAQVSELLDRGVANIVKSHVDSFMMTGMRDASFGFGEDVDLERRGHDVPSGRDRDRVRQEG